VILVLVSIFVNMPVLVLVVFSSFAGALGVVGGLMLLVGSLNSADFTRGDFTDTVENGLGLVTTPAGAGARRDLQSGPAASRAAPHHPRDVVRRDP
jgi:hypothetical protein